MQSRLLFLFLVGMLLMSGCNEENEITSPAIDPSVEVDVETLDEATFDDTSEVDEMVENTADEPQADTLPNVPDEYLSSSFRVLYVVYNPDEYFYLTIATDRATDDWQNDSICGSMYSQPTCYFFVESDYAVDSPKTTFLGTPDLGGAVDFESITFLGDGIVQFEARDGDGGMSWHETWELDIGSKTFTLLSGESYGPVDY